MRKPRMAHYVLFTDPVGVDEIDSRWRTRKEALGVAKRRREHYGSGWSWRVRSEALTDGETTFGEKRYNNDGREYFTETEDTDQQIIRRE